MFSRATRSRTPGVHRQPGRLPAGVRDGDRRPARRRCCSRRCTPARRTRCGSRAAGAATCPRSRRPRPDGPPRILAGDFNATLDHALLRRLLATGYVDAADRDGRGAGGHVGAVRRRPHPAGHDRPRAGGPPDRRTRRVGARGVGQRPPGRGGRAVAAAAGREAVRPVSSSGTGRRSARRPARASSPRRRSRARRRWSSPGRCRRRSPRSTRVIAPVPCEPSRMRTL